MKRRGVPRCLVVKYDMQCTRPRWHVDGHLFDADNIGRQGWWRHLMRVTDWT